MYGTQCAYRANVNRFETYCKRKEEAALAASLSGFRSVEDDSRSRDMTAIGSDWTRRLFDGPFYRSAGPGISLVFVQSRDGNTVAPDPSTLGGGETDKHLVYEGLSRVDADGVLAGATTARSEEMVFSNWHPELVALRQARGHGRHPAQIVVTDTGDLPFDRGLMFTEPGLRVFLITGSRLAAEIRDRLQARPWIEIIDAGTPVSLTAAVRALGERGVHVISAVGGRKTATALLREGLVRDIYLTTSPIEAGEPGTPFYEGPPLKLSRIIEKTGRGSETGVRFEHFVIGDR